MAYASERAAGWGDQQIANFEHLLAQPDPVLLDWFMRRTRPGDEELKLLVDEILASKTGSSVL
jgi:succinate dehydrogenase flavin-adding protein (antitoxin of CptAB toxin-antitoxin module)